MKRKRSHPMRVRGLKLLQVFTNLQMSLSHPMRVRGLKLSALQRIVLFLRRTPCGCVD